MSNRNCHLRNCDKSFESRGVMKLFGSDADGAKNHRPLSSVRQHDPSVTIGRSMSRVFCGHPTNFHPPRNGNATLFFSFA